MKKYIYITTAFVIFMVLILPGLAAIPIKLAPFNDQPGYSVNNRVSIFYNNVIAQKFISQKDNLTAIGITLGNPNLKNKKDVILSLYDSDDKLVRKSTLNGLNIADGAYVRFIFDPIPSSKDAKFTFTIESPDARAEDVIYAYHTKDKPSWFGDTYFDNKLFEEGALPFVTYFKPVSKISLIRDIYSSWGRRVLGFTD